MDEDTLLLLIPDVLHKKVCLCIVSPEHLICPSVVAPSPCSFLFCTVFFSFVYRILQLPRFILQGDCQQPGMPGAEVLSWLFTQIAPHTAGEKAAQGAAEEGEKGSHWIYIISDNPLPSALTTVAGCNPQLKVAWAALRGLRDEVLTYHLHCSAAFVWLADCCLFC